MNKLSDKIHDYAELYKKIKSDSTFASKLEMPEKSYFIGNDEILAIPRDDGDCRYPYGTGGFNFWAYASGYMHCNEGIFSPFLRAEEGQEPKIAFFASIQDKEGNSKIVPLLSVPIINDDIELEHYTIFTKSCVYYITEIMELRFAVRVFVNDERRMMFSITVENLGSKNENIILSTYFNPFLMHDIVENVENKWFREVRYYSAGNKDSLGHFIIKTNEDLSRTASVSNYGIIRRNIECGENSCVLKHEETCSRYQYVEGSRGSLHTPKALKGKAFKNQKHVCAFTEVGVAGDIISLELGQNDTIRYDIVFDYIMYCNDGMKLEKIVNCRIEPAEIDASLTIMEDNEQQRSQDMNCRVGESIIPELKGKVFNSFFEHLKKQVEFCSLIKGYVQLSAGSLIGIRDVFQAVEGLVAWQPKLARGKMLEALGFIAPNGKCPRQYSLPSREGDVPAMDLRSFIDQGVWVISTIVTYLKYTGDFAFLNEECGYYEIVDEKRKLVKKSDIKDSVLEHMLRIMNYLIENRDFDKTMCVRALFGDWNDALDGLGVSNDPEQEFGSGVSVMVTLQVYQNLKEMEELLGKIDQVKYGSLISEYRKVSDEIKHGLKKYAVVVGEKGQKKIVHGWGDKMSYFVGSFDDPDHKSRQGLTSNAFWVLSKLYDEDMGIKATILNAFEKLDSKYGLKTFEPHFDPDTKGVGRIPKLPAGTAENGAAYIHASVFGIMALFRMGSPELAWIQLVKSLPFTHDYVSCSPYIMPNSYGLNEEMNIDGQSMQDWQTGSSNVLLKLLIKYVFGICPEYDGVWIQPALFIPFESFEFRIKIKDCNICLSYNHYTEGSRTFIVNDEPRRGVFDKVMQLDKLWISNEELKYKQINILITDM